MGAAWDGMPSYPRLGPDELAVRVFGDCDRRPVEPDSPELIFVAVRR
jgi:hypothetical protein